MPWVYVAECEECAVTGPHADGSYQGKQYRFTTRTERDAWVYEHLMDTGHFVARRAEAS